MEYCAGSFTSLWPIFFLFLKGGDLCHLIQNRHLSADEANALFIQLIHGVAYIHSMGVAHRDLKPENCMIPFFA
jgi:protein-serine/threonine kinase